MEQETENIELRVLSDKIADALDGHNSGAACRVLLSALAEVILTRSDGEPDRAMSLYENAGDHLLKLLHKRLACDNLSVKDSVKDIEGLPCDLPPVIKEAIRDMVKKYDVKVSVISVDTEK